jgi:uncharacterized protein (DUF2062 family)
MRQGFGKNPPTTRDFLGFLWVRLLWGSSVLRKLAAHFQALGGKLLDLRDTPHALAGGVAIGMFVGFTPLFGLKTLLCLALAYLLRCNPIAAVIAVSLHDVVTPLWPILLELEYAIGRRVMGLFGALPPAVDQLHFHMHDLMKWTTFFGLGLPMLVGSMFLSIPAAFAAYWLTFPLFKRRIEKRSRSEHAGTP